MLRQAAMMFRVTLYHLLGPIEVTRDGRPAELGGPKQRAVLAVLLLDAGRVVSTDRIVDAVWGGDHPPSVAASLQAFISNLRRVLRDDARATSPIVRKAPGYLIDVAPEDLDVSRFAAECGAAQAAVDHERWADAVAAAEAALALWRGPLLAEYADEEWVRVVAAPIEEQRAACEQNLVVGLLGGGRITAALARTSRMVSEQPLSERAYWLHMVALYRAGRAADALEAFAEHSRRMDDELGLDVGPALRDLQGAVLRQDDELAAWPQAVTGPTPSVVEPERPALDVAPITTAEPVTSERGDLVGREREVAVVESVLGEAAAGTTRWLVLTGVAGIGKSRLAEQAAAIWTGRVARAACPDDEGVPPWWPVRQLLRELGADPDVELLPPPDVDADAARFAAYDRVIAVLGGAVRERPLLLLVEDVHWADPTSLRLLTHLAESTSLGGLAVVITVRDATGGPEVGRLLAAVARRAGSRQLALPPLSAREVAQLASQVSGQVVAGGEAAQLAARTGGNPFFVCEYARLPPDERASGEVPVAVRSVLGRRLAGLDPAVLQVLRTAAVMGESLDIELLGEVTRLDRDELADLLDEAADEHVIVPARGSGGYVFAHALLRDEVVAGMSGIRRQRLHLRIADAVGAGGGPDQLVRRAAHLVAAGPLAEAADVFDACRVAALDAEARWQSDSAAHWWGQAIDAFDLLGADAPADRDDLLVARVSALARAGRGQTVLDVIDAGLLDAVRRDRLDSAGRLASTLLRTSGSWPWAVYGSDPAPLLARLAGVETRVAANPAAHVSVLAALAVGSCYDPDPSVPHAISARALEIATGLDDPDALADALLGRALMFSGVAIHAEESVALLGRLATVPHRTSQIDDVIAHGLMFLATLSLGDPAAAEHARLGVLGSDVLRLANSRVQFRWGEATLALWRGDDLAVVAAAYNRALELHRQTELYESGVFDVAMLALGWEQGRLGRDEIGTVNPRFLPWAAAVCAAATGDPAAADLIAGELARPEPAVWTTHGRLTLLAHAVADLGLRRHADELIERLTPVAHCVANIGQVGVVGPVALALARLRVLVGDVDAARRNLSDASAIARRSQAAGALVRCRLLAAQLADLAGDPVDHHDVRDLLAEARRRGMGAVERDAAELLGRVAVS